MKKFPVKNEVEFYEKKIAKLEAEIERLHKISMVDPLTGLFNRRYLMSQMEKLSRDLSLGDEHRIQRAQVSEIAGISIVIIDLMNLKGINDDFGHDVGDEAIVFLSKILLKVARKDDMVLRLNEGGDEFVVILYTTDKCQAKKFISRLNTRLASEKMLIKNTQLEIEVAAGYSFSKIIDFDYSKAMKIADEQMYIDKGHRKALKSH